MGLIWKRDPLNQLLPPSLTTSKSSHPYMDLSEEFELRSFLTRLDNLRGAASSEVDLRGPFQDDVYVRVLDCTSKMLDAFHAMNVMIMKNPRASKGETEILRYTTNERAQLCSRISHLFQVLASSMKLQYPLNEALPSADNARDRLLAKLFHFRQTEKEKLGATDEDFELLYAYGKSSPFRVPKPDLYIPSHLYPLNRISTTDTDISSARDWPDIDADRRIGQGDGGAVRSFERRASEIGMTGG